MTDDRTSNDRTSDDRRTNELSGALAAAAPRPLTPEAAAEVDLLTSLLADPSTWQDPRPGLEDDVVATIARERTAPRPARPGRHRGWVVASVAAATVAVALGAGAAVVALQPASAPGFRAHLAATALAPRAAASADIAHTKAGFRIRLDASHLPSLPAGEFFQAWLADAQGTKVPVGTFSSSDDRVTLWSGVSPATFSRLTVTIEQTDGVEASSGRVVLTGVVHPH